MQERRSGPDNHRSGPRLPYTRTKVVPGVDQLPRDNADDLDPANGEKVPRCRVCGIPGINDNRLVEGVWSSGGFGFRFRLCERCIREAA